MQQIIFERLIAPISDIPPSMIFEGVPPSADETPTGSVLIYWRFEDEADKGLQFLEEVVAGEEFSFPLDHKGRVVEFFTVSKTKTGALSVPNPLQGEYHRFDPGAKILASEDLLYGELLNHFVDSGVTKARKADATDATKPCQSFAGNDALTGEYVRPLKADSDIIGLAGKTPGVAQYLSTTPGQMTESPAADPVADVGKLVQKIGTALSPTTVDFNPETGAPVIGTGSDTPYAPSNLMITDVGTVGIHDDLQLDWTNNGGTGDNIIERADGGFTFVEIDRVAFNIATYTDTVVNTVGSIYVYRIRNASVLGYSTSAEYDF